MDEHFVMLTGGPGNEREREREREREKEGERERNWLLAKWKSERAIGIMSTRTGEEKCAVQSCCAAKIGVAGCWGNTHACNTRFLLPWPKKLSQARKLNIQWNHARQITRLCHVRTAVSIFLARVVVHTHQTCTRICTHTYTVTRVCVCVCVSVCLCVCICQK